LTTKMTMTLRPIRRPDQKFFAAAAAKAQPPQPERAAPIIARDCQASVAKS
jgi:hypothetical protein